MPNSFPSKPLPQKKAMLLCVKGSQLDAFCP